jgi:catechol 2,3-dioxygenase-like lactoylglutathione lyase family enzyme
MTAEQAVTPLGVRGIDNVLFAVGDLGAAVHFYAGRLGLPLAFRLDDPGVALFRLGDEPPGLLVRQGPTASAAPGSPRVWLEVADARAATVALAAAGVTPLGEPFRVATGWTVEVADPWGNVVGFTDYTAMPERGRPA